MPVRNTGGCRRQNTPGPETVPELPTEQAPEPAMRRWPHPVAEVPPPEGLEAELHRINCTLSHQTRLLGEISRLLEKLANGAGD